MPSVSVGDRTTISRPLFKKKNLQKKTVARKLHKYIHLCTKSWPHLKGDLNQSQSFWANIYTFNVAFHPNIYSRRRRERKSWVGTYMYMPLSLQVTLLEKLERSWTLKKKDQFLVRRYAQKFWKISGHTLPLNVL